MNDLISREAAVYIASGYCHPANIADELRKLPSAEPQWIPCGERMPTEDKSTGYLITDGYGDVYQVSLWKDANGKPCFRTYEVGWDIEAVAWMQMPEPYKGESK